MTTGYTGLLKIPAGYPLWIAGVANFTSGGAITVLDTIIQGANGGAFTWNPSGTSTTTSGKIKLLGTGEFLNSKAGTWVSFECAAATKTTTISATQSATARYENFKTGTGTLTLNGVVVIYSTANPSFTNGGGTINGTNGGLQIQGTTGTFSLPATALAGSGLTLNMQSVNNSAWTITAAGHISCTGTMTITGNGSNSTLTFNSGTNPTYYNITSGGALTLGGAGGATTLNFNSSTITAASIANYNIATTTVNFGSSSWIVAGNFVLGTNMTVTAGTSLISFTAAATLTSAGKTLYDIATSAGTLTSDALICNSITTSGTGGFTSGVAKVKTTDDQTYNGSGILTLAALDTISGNGDFHIGSTVGAVTVSACSLYLQGAGFYDIDKASTSIYTSCAAATKTTTITGAAANTYTLVTSTGTLAINTTYVIYFGVGFTVGRLMLEPGSQISLTSGNSYGVTAYTAGDWDGTSASKVNIYATTSGTPGLITNPAGMTVNYMYVEDNTASNPIIAYTTLGNQDGGGNTNWTFVTPSTATRKRGIYRYFPYKKDSYKSDVYP